MTSINIISHWFDSTMGLKPQSTPYESSILPIEPLRLVSRVYSVWHVMRTCATVAHTECPGCGGGTLTKQQLAPAACAQWSAGSGYYGY